MNLKRTLFVLPNLFTLSSVFCGVYAIILCGISQDPFTHYKAALAIFFAIFFDLFDGRIARLTRTQSEFGIQLDSLADVISFGIAPAVLIYHWALHHYGTLGLAISFIFVACGAIRLARFNLTSLRSRKTSDWFSGLPIPVAAALIISLVMAHYRVGGGEVVQPLGILILSLVLSYLMVSNVRYYSYKNLRHSPRRVAFALSVMLILVAFILTHKIRTTFALVAVFSTYTTLGLLEEVIFFRRRRTEERLATAFELAEENEEEEMEEIEEG